MKINKILAIAINEYDNDELNQIQNCKSDVEAIIKVLDEKYNFDDVEFIYKKEDTTRQKLTRRINEYFVNCLADENVLLIFAGHGEFNNILNVGYWLPSDAEKSDFTTWISFADILMFLNASKAFHIGIIFDCCFSGAIFQPKKRGGGIDAFKNKKSRQGLTSGGVEKVSDGKAGELSPFAQALVDGLVENEKDNLPFIVFANNLISSFDKSRGQTPMFGNLDNVGHEGGSFVFELKKQYKDIQEDDSALESLMKNLHIDIPDSVNEIIANLKILKDEKIELVRQQKYSEAAKIRDQEIEASKVISENFINYLDSILQNIKFTEEEIKNAENLNANIEKYILQKEQDVIQIEENEKYFYVNTVTLVEDFFEENPENTLFNQNKAKFLELYDQNVLYLYDFILRLKGTSNSEYLDKKINDLKEILTQIIQYETRLMINGYENESEEIVSIRELNVMVENWILNN